MNDAEIRDWVRKAFNNVKPKIFLDLGSHRGGATRWLVKIPNTIVHAFEPDLRNEQTPTKRVVVHREAIAAYDGVCDFYLSTDPDMVNLASSSIRRPASHLTLYPEVTFGEAIQVPCITLDSFIERAGISAIDFVWADVQGAEGDMIQGGQKALARTRYLYTEVCPDDSEPWYEGQVRYSEIMRMLPAWRLLKRFPNDILLENRRFKK